MSLVKQIGGFVGEWAENTSEAPEDLRRLADKESRRVTDAAQEIERQSAESGRNVESNLRTSAGASYGGTVGRWLSKPVNFIGSVVLIIGIIWAVQAGKL